MLVEPTKGDMVLLKTGSRGLVLEVHRLDGIGVFFDILLPDGELVMVDYSDIERVM
jgi:hypothetical protein